MWVFPHHRDWTKTKLGRCLFDFFPLLHLFVQNKELTSKECVKSVAHNLTVQYFGYFLGKCLSTVPHYELAQTFTGLS